MTACLGKSCLFDLLCVLFRECLSVCVFASFPDGFEGGMWHWIIFIPDHRLSLYFDSFNLINLD